MIDLRTAQFDEMERLRTDDDWVAVIIDQLRSRFPGRFDPATTRFAEQRVRAGMARARRWQLTAFQDVAAWVLIMFDVSARFDEIPALRAVLEDDSLGPPSARLARLGDRKLDLAWEDAAHLVEDFPAEYAAWFSTPPHAEARDARAPASEASA